jgi:PAS domain S-box-containing protein
LNGQEHTFSGTWPPGESAAAKLIRAHPWSETSLGPLAGWSERLKGAVDLALACSYPMIVLWGHDLIQIYNDGYREILAGKHPRGMGQSTRECWPEVWDFNAPIYARVFNGETVTFEDQLYPLMRHGYIEDTYLSLCYSPLRGEEGDVAGVLVTVFDTTRQTEARLRAERREAFLTQLHDSTHSLAGPDAIIRTAADLLREHLGADRVVYCTFEPDEDTFETTSVSLGPGVPALAGRYRLKSFGETATHLRHCRLRYVSNDTENEQIGADEKAVFRHASIGAHASVMLHRAGKLVAAMAVHQMSPREWRSDEVELVQVVVNRCWESIERIRAESELRQQWHTFDTALSHTVDFIYIFDLQGRFTYINRALLRLWARSFEDSIGKNFFELDYPPALAARLQAEIQQVIETGQPLRGETPFTGFDKRERTYEYIFVPVLDERGRTAMVAGSTRDITEHRQTEISMRASLVERDTLLKEIHHRVKNNLQVIVSLLGLQSDRVTDAAALAAFRDTQSRVRAIAGIHETLYSSADLAAVEFGHYARLLVNDLMTFYDASQDRIHLKLNTEKMVMNIDQAIPLGLVLNELFTNALKHGFPHHACGTIEVWLRYLPDEADSDQKLRGPKAMLCVQHDGIKMPAEVDFKTTKSMGLYLIRLLARQLQGRVDVERGAWTGFRLTFPIASNHPSTLP